MATFIQGDPGLRLDPVLYTPDYNFLRYVLQRKTSQYEQGLKSVAGTLGALKKDLSDPTLIQRRDNYLKSAESQLQKIASADLSLQQNVNAANAVFDPIISDPAIVYDSYHTADNRRQLSTMESWAASDDMATRKKFNQEIYDWVKRDLDSLKTGNGDINNYKVQGRKAWAYVDAQDLVNQAAKDMGFKVENDELGKPYIVTTVGGKSNRENYELFAKGVLDANPVYKQQLSILGQARVEKNIADVKALNPQYASLSKPELLRIYSDREYDKGKERQKTYIDSLNEKASVQQADANAYMTTNAAKIKANPQGEEAQIAAKKVADLELYRKQIASLRSDFSTTFGSDDQTAKARKEAFVKGFTDNPEGYYSKQIELEDVIRWSNVRSAFGSRSIKADQAYISMVNAADKALNTLNNIKDDQFDNQMDVAELGLKMQGKTSSGEKKKNADGTDKLSDVEFVDVSSTDISVTTKLNQLKNRLAVSKAAGIQNMTGTFGGLYLLEKMGTKPEDVALVRQVFTKKETQPGYKPTKEENDALSKAYDNLFSFAKLNNQEDVLATMRGQVKNKEAVGNIDIPSLLRAAARNYEPKDQYERNAIRQLAEYENNQAEVKTISEAVEKGQQVAIRSVKGISDFDKIVRKKDGKETLINDDDIRALLTQKNISGQGEVIPADVKERMIAAYFDGTLKVDITRPEGAASAARTGGSTVGYVDINFEGKKYQLFGDLFANTATPKEYQKLMKRLNERVPIPEFTSQISGAGALGSAIFVIRNEMREKIAETLVSTTQTNSNIKQQVGGELNSFEDVPADQQAEVRSALADKKNIVDMRLRPTSTINEGQQIVEVTFAKKTSKDDPNIWSGKTYYFPINVTGRSADVFKLFADVDEIEEFNQYSKQNKPYVMDYHQASGVKAVIMADQPGSKTGTVRLYSKYDPVTKTYTDNWIEQPPIPFDLNKVTFSEVKEQVYNNFFSPYLDRRMAYNAQTQNNQTGSGNELFNQLMKKLNQQ